MGSLMAGWSSHALDDHHKVRFMRNRSLTNRDVEAFWRKHKKPGTTEVDDDNAGEIVVVTTPPPLASSPRESPRSLRPSVLSHVRSSPPEMARTDADGGSAASPSTSLDWWSRSSWAFLNEPPPQSVGGQGHAAFYHASVAEATK